jgi:hypothetical protein
MENNNLSKGIFLLYKLGDEKVSIEVYFQNENI